MKTVCTDRAEEMVRLLKGNQSFQVLAIDARMKSAQPEMLAQQARTLRPEAELSIVLFNADEKDKLRFDYTNEVVSAVIPAELDRSKILNILLGVFSEESLHGKRESQLQQLDKNFAGSLPLSILVAEDNVISQKLAVAIFDGLGYRIDIAVNGLQAVNKVKENQYDLLFMDVQMPEMDGFEATRIILRDLRQPPVIIAMTAFALEGDREKCLEAGMSDYISKPILVEEIVEKLQRWGKGEQQETGTTASVHSVPDANLLDQNVIGRLKELNEKVEQGFFNEVVSMFLNQAPALINEMIIYCNDQRYDKMGQAAHKLKGSALNIGAKAMAELCREIEIKGRNNDGTDCSQTLEKLRALFAETERELMKLIS
jgi:CheY-like chemotaxis protein/HPt (histidine-containing phosphotransfer) domain-containing protein